MTAFRVRHEAGEALGAIGTPECLQLLEQYQKDPCLEVAQTCQLALQRIQYYNRLQSSASSNPEQPFTPGTAATSSSPSSPPRGVLEGTHNSTGAAEESASPYLSVDPAPAAPASTPTEQLRATLLDERAPIFERYRALFALRNKVLASLPWLAWHAGKCPPLCNQTSQPCYLLCQSINAGWRCVPLCDQTISDMLCALPEHRYRSEVFLTRRSTLRLAHAARGVPLCRVELKPSGR